MHGRDDPDRGRWAPKVAGAREAERAPERVEAYKLPGALLLHEALRANGEDEMRRSSRSLLASGLAGGLSMGLSLAAAGLLHAHLPPTPWRPVLTGLAFALGFIVVMIGRQGLITESTLTGVLPLLSHPSRGTARDLGRLWAFVFAGNLVGATLFALVTARTEVFSPEARRAFDHLGQAMLTAPFGLQLLRAVIAGWLIALALWMSPAVGSARLIVIALLVWLVGMAHLGHIVSGSVETLHVVLRGDATLAEYVGRFLIPVLLGNLFGGALLVAGLNHAQVAREQRNLLPELRPRSPESGAEAGPEQPEGGVPA